MILVKTVKNILSNSQIRLDYPFEYSNFWSAEKSRNYLSTIINLREIDSPIAENIILSYDYGKNDGQTEPVIQVFDGLNRLLAWKAFFENSLSIIGPSGELFFRDLNAMQQQVITNNIKFNVSILNFSDKEKPLFNNIFNSMHS